MSEILHLPERLDFDAARTLHGQLLALRGHPVSIDGSAVRTGGALAAQVLLAAARDWRAAGQPFAFAPSVALQDDLERLGVLSEIAQEEATA
ncbi:STAS domain-containing protein [Tabrizicola aquatica]|jgi:anti-anti-sigma regulatory factor|uniref:STAS domain-containing protein n=1 Tax=Tabrizicola aquatica TaxID=909926 RepID=UPI000CD0CC97|nr:STAS domain-containing protein [Tabrizicola aquatica]